MSLPDTILGVPGKRQGRVATAESPERDLARVPLHFLPEFAGTNRESPLHRSRSNPGPIPIRWLPATVWHDRGIGV